MESKRLITKEIWSKDLRIALTRKEKPIPPQDFERWVKKAEKVTGKKRHYKGVGNKRRMYLNPELANLISFAIKMRYS